MSHSHGAFWRNKANPKNRAISTRVSGARDLGTMPAPRRDPELGEDTAVQAPWPGAQVSRLLRLGDGTAGQASAGAPRPIDASRCRTTEACDGPLQAGRLDMSATPEKRRIAPQVIESALR